LELRFSIKLSGLFVRAVFYHDGAVKNGIIARAASLYDGHVPEYPSADGNNRPLSNTGGQN
jgi:hypothetical protein